MSVERSSTLYMQTSIETFLRNQGFNSKDIKVYLDIYKYGQSFASTISNRTGIDRTTTYSVLKRLLKNSIIFKTKKGDTQLYMAVSPNIFMDKLDRQIQDLSVQKKSTQVFIDEMLKIQRRSFLKPRTRIFEGSEAIINLYLQTIQNAGTQKAFLTIANIPESIRHFLKEEFIKLKIKNKVFSKVLIAETPFAKRYHSLDENSNRQTKIIKKHPFKLHSEILLFNKSNVAMIDFREDLYGVVIESETLYKSIEALFDYIWLSES